MLIIYLAYPLSSLSVLYQLWKCVCSICVCFSAGAHTFGLPPSIFYMFLALNEM